MKRLQDILLLAATASLLACGGGDGTLALLHPTNRPPKSADQVQLFTGSDHPDCKFDVFGEIQADDRSGGRPPSTEVTFQKMRESVAQAGGDGIISVHCSGAGYVGSGNAACSGQAYVCKH